MMVFLVSSVLTFVEMVGSWWWWNPVVGWYEYIDKPRRQINHRRWATMSIIAIVANMSLVAIWREGL